MDEIGCVPKILRTETLVRLGGLTYAELLGKLPYFEGSFKIFC